MATLDGFRAVLALWVFFGHVANAVQLRIPIVSAPWLAVDLFMLLSGFLMVHTWKGPPGEVRLFSRTTFHFYVGRFFRIAPLFYFLCLVCAVFLPHLNVMTVEANRALPMPWVTDPATTAPHEEWNFASVKWVLLHLTFLYGCVPGMENSSPMPEWSLSLEMQFYAVLPLLLVVMRRVPAPILAALFAAAALVSPRFLGSYLQTGTLVHFGQPSLLTYRMNVFFLGMLVALWLRESREGGRLLPRNASTMIAAGLCMVPLNKLLMLASALMTMLTTTWVPFCTRFFAASPMRYLGHISYSIYLCHQLVLIPAKYVLVTRFQMGDWHPAVRFAVMCGVALPLVLLFSHVLYRWIELPGIRLGRKLVKKQAGAAHALHPHAPLPANRPK